MDILEVKMIDDFGDEGEGIARAFRRWTAEGETVPVVSTINGYEFRHTPVAGRSMYYVFKDDECVARATVDDAKGMENTAKVSHIVVHPAHRRKGLGMAIYELVMKDKTVVSDYDQTRFGRAMWQQLANKHVVRPLEMDDTIGEPITDITRVYGTPTRMVANLR